MNKTTNILISKYKINDFAHHHDPNHNKNIYLLNIYNRYVLKLSTNIYSLALFYQMASHLFFI